MVPKGNNSSQPLISPTYTLLMFFTISPSQTPLKLFLFTQPSKFKSQLLLVKSSRAFSLLHPIHLAFASPH